MPHGHVEYLQQRLRDHGFRITTERSTILRSIFDDPDHFDAEGLLDRLRTSGAAVSRATVYRTLTCLVDAGLLRRYEPGDRGAEYEPTVGKEHHEHMTCVECGTVIEFVEDEIERLQDIVCRKHGFLPISHTLHIHGVCESCQGPARWDVVRGVPRGVDRGDAGSRRRNAHE